MIKRNIVITILIIVTGCKTPEIVTTFNTVNLNETHSYINYKNPLIYYLPRNVILVDVEITETKFVAGPFAEYAEKLLGIINAELENSIEYRISNIDINTTVIPDTNQIYLVENENFDKHVNFINLSPSGIIKSINCIDDRIFHEDGLIEHSIISRRENQLVHFKDLSIKPNVVEKTERTYTTVKTDSTVKRVPVIKKRIVVKESKEKAEEAAAFIIKLRKRRFKVMAGMYESHPDGLAVKNMVEELNVLEEEYLSLFIGREYTTLFVKNFYFNPQPENDITRKILFKFSSKEGIVNSDNKSRMNIQQKELGAMPIIINVVPLTQSLKLNEFLELQKNKFKEKPGFHHRQPSMVRIEIISDMQIIYSNKTLLAQYGEVYALPVSLFKDKNIEIKYHEKYGSLKSINSK